VQSKRCHRRRSLGTPIVHPAFPVTDATTTATRTILAAVAEMIVVGANVNSPSTAPTNVSPINLVSAILVCVCVFCVFRLLGLLLLRFYFFLSTYPHTGTPIVDGRPHSHSHN
jgi:hypothetical protein